MAKRKTKAELAMQSDGQVFVYRLRKAAEGLDRGEIYNTVKDAVDLAWATGLNRGKMIDKTLSILLD